MQPSLYKSQLEQQFYNIVDKPAPELSEESKMQMMKNTLFNGQDKENQEKQQLITEIVADHPCKIKFQQLVDAKDKKFQQKRILAKFFGKYLENGSELSFQKLEQQLLDFEQEKQKETEIITVNFLKEFKGQKTYFKENYFTLYEIGNFLADQKITQSELQIISKYLIKVKKLFNLKNGNTENIFVVDPNLKISLDLLNNVLDIQCQKVIYENEVLNECIDKILTELDRLATQHQPNTSRVISIFERNVIIDTALKYFKQLDIKLLDSVQLIAQMHQFLLDTEEKDLNLPKIHQQLQLLLGEITQKELDKLQQQSPTLRFFSTIPKQQQQQKTINNQQLKKDLEFFSGDPNIPTKDVLTKDEEADNLVSLFNNKKPNDSELFISKNFGDTMLSHTNDNPNEIKLHNLDPFKSQKESYTQSLLQSCQLPKSQFQPLTISQAFYHPSYEFKDHQYDPEEEKKKVEELELQELKRQKEEEEEDPNLRLSGLLKKQKNMEQNLRMSQSKLLLPSQAQLDKNFEQQLSNLKSTIDSQYYRPKHIGLGKYKPTSDKFLDYQTYLPTDYYSNLITNENQQGIQAKEKQQDWYLRAHHIETLTEHPFSSKDNVMDTKYAAFLSSQPKSNAFTQPLEVQQSQDTKQQLIDSLESKIGELKKDLVMQKYKSYVNNTMDQQQQKLTMSPQDSQKFQQMQRYYDSIQKNEKKELLSGTYQSLLDDLRKQERDILNAKRSNEIISYGPPKDKWWEDKTSDFNPNLKKYQQSLSKKKNQYEDVYNSLAIQELY